MSLSDDFAWAHQKIEEIDEAEFAELKSILGMELISAVNDLDEIDDEEIMETSFRDTIVRLQLVAFLAGVSNSGPDLLPQEDSDAISILLSDAETEELALRLIRNGSLTFKLTRE